MAEKKKWVWIKSPQTGQVRRVHDTPAVLGGFPGWAKSDSRESFSADKAEAQTEVRHVEGAQDAQSTEDGEENVNG